VISFEQSGDGPPLIIVDGAIAYREVGPSGMLAKSFLTCRSTLHVATRSKPSETVRKRSCGA
jgi:hypothetical protein